MAAIVAVTALLIAISLLDRTTELFHITMLFAVPIVIASYSFGLRGGLLTALLALTEVVATHSLKHSATLAADVATDSVVFLFVAVVTDRLSGQLRTIRELEARRDFDLGIARDVQQRMLTPPPVDIRFEVAYTLRSAFEVGGDYYRFDEVDDRLFLCVGDISGKGITAALFASLLDETLAEALSDHGDLEQTVSALNRRMYDSMPPEMFVTMFCGLLGDDSITYVNAGHVRPLVYENTTKRVTELSEAGTLPLGIDPECAMSTATRPLAEGDTLLVFSDGVTESPTFLRKPQLLALTFEETVAAGPGVVVERVAALAESAGQADDVTVVCVRRTAQGVRQGASEGQQGETAGEATAGLGAVRQGWRQGGG